MRTLLDTNVLVYRFDPRDVRKQAVATHLLRMELAANRAHLTHQNLLEFMAAVTRPSGPGGRPLLEPAEAAWEVEELLRQFPVLYPEEGILRLAVRGWRTYGFSWFNAHLWSYAEWHGIDTLYSEDFQHDRLYGTVRVCNPFL